MLNLQRAIIFCVLFAAVSGQPNSDLTDKQKRLLRNFEDSLIRVEKNRNLIPENGINHFNSWSSWDKISDFMKLRIAERYAEKLAKVELLFNGKVNDKLPELAFEALDDHVKWWVELFATSDKKNIKEMAGEMREVMIEGKFLEYLAFNGSGGQYLKKRRQTKVGSTSTK